MESTKTHSPVLTVSELPSIGSPWAGLSAPMPRRMDNAQPSMQPFVDIYNEIIRLDESIESLINQQTDNHNVLMAFMDDYRALPWVRLWLWLSTLFGREKD